MAGLVPAIYTTSGVATDGRDKPGHDGLLWPWNRVHRFYPMARQRPCARLIRKEDEV
jgi:hypothetical protein